MTTVTLESLYQNHSDMVYRVCLRYTKNHEEAQDMLQDVFIKISEKLKSFNSKAQISTWIYRIAVNRCLDKLREIKRHRRLEKDNIHTLIERNINLQSKDSLTELTLAKILSFVDKKTCETLFLYFSEGLTHQEISEIQGVTRVAITKRITSFKKRIVNRDNGELREGVFSCLLPFLLVILFLLLLSQEKFKIWVT